MIDVALQELSAAHCYKILSQISDEDCLALGFDVRYTRPDWMLVSVLPVPPPPVRPSVMMDSSARCVHAQLAGCGMISHPLTACSRNLSSLAMVAVVLVTCAPHLALWVVHML